MPSKKRTATGSKKGKGKAKATIADSEAPVTKGEFQAPEVKSSELKKATSVDIFHDHIYIRSYSEEAHGEGFMELANEFLAKHPKGHMLPSSETKTVVVRYREKEDAELHPDKQDPRKPFVDKQKVFENKEEALRFNLIKKGTVVRGK